MGLWDRLFGRKSAAASTPRTEPTAAPAAAVDASEAAAAEIDPALQPALTAFQRSDHIEAYNAAQAQLHLGADAQRLCALSLSALTAIAKPIRTGWRYARWSPPPTTPCSWRPPR